MSLNQPLVSVLMPAYNHEKFVERAVRSVLAQTYPNIELLVLDDGSKDNTWSVLQNLQQACAQQLTRIYMQTQPNAGTSTTLSRLLSQAKGGYILLLASDDELLPGCIETEVNFLEQHPQTVLCVGNNQFIDANENRLERSFPDGKFYPLGTSTEHLPTFGAWLQKERPDVDFHSSQFGTYATLLPGNYLPNGIMFRKSALDRCAPLTPQAPLEDWFLNLQMAKQGPFAYLDEPLFAYRIHGNNTIKNIQKMDRLHHLTRYYEWHLAYQDKNPQWKQIFDDFVFTFHTRYKWGFCGIYLEKRFNFLCSQTRLQLGKKGWILRNRQRNPLPAWHPAACTQ